MLCARTSPTIACNEIFCARPIAHTHTHTMRDQPARGNKMQHTLTHTHTRQTLRTREIGAGSGDVCDSDDWLARCALKLIAHHSVPAAAAAAATYHHQVRC